MAAHSDEPADTLESTVFPAIRGDETPIVRQPVKRPGMKDAGNTTNSKKRTKPVIRRMHLFKASRARKK